MPTLVTQKDIADMALVLLGQDALTSYDEDSRNARAIRSFYESSRLSVLEDYKWSFSTKRQELSPLASTPAFGWEYQFSLPHDFLKEQYVYSNTGTRINNYRIESGKLLCDESVIRLVYTWDNDVPSTWSAKFSELLATKLAAKACYRVTQSRTEANSLMDEYRTSLIETIGNDSQGDGEPKLQENAGSWTSGI